MPGSDTVSRGVTTRSVDDAYAKFEGLGETERKMALDAMRAEVIRRCGESGEFFLNFVKTRDEVDLHGNTVKPFPKYDYVLALWREIEQNQKVIIAKSRQMMVSWIACAFAVWWARRRPNQLVLMQTQNWDDALKLVSVAGGDRDAAYLGRCQFIERHLPSFLRVKVKESEGQIAYPDNGSIIQALPGGADKIRGKVPSLVVLDEFAMHEEAWGEWTALAPLVQGAMKLVVISTPNGADGNCFYSLYTGTQKSAPKSG